MTEQERDKARAAAECKIFMVRVGKNKPIAVAARTIDEAAVWARKHMNHVTVIRELDCPSYNAMQATVVVGSARKK